MEFPPEVSVTTATSPNSRTTWDREQRARVSFLAAAGRIEAWVDAQGFLNLRAVDYDGLVIFPDGQSQIRVRPGR